ncbi:hypothetical protein HUN01_24960 [Nostoc edaphicum CCNP1411]|uniref:CDP-glycerol glycerophosphotransferase family protein n=1 Tax=Nostoc edaphicum CCNP1411 TaxID=1472755 RepID=A0A7D7LFJ7_9NOSO|nr:hypothetical protein [Nostoc edaphicum]QMS90674.1 hypothetical protein HUN01_24960 [Nostoc edaphicum CCNP1411]
MINFIRFWNHKPTVLVFIHLIQDLDLVLPLLVGLQYRNDLVPQVCVLDQILNKSPRIKSALQKLGIKYSKVSRLGVLTGVEPNLLNIQGLITASESTAGPHKAAYALTKRANKSGILTYTLQHGFENVGLNYFDDLYTAKNTRFASQKVLTWGDTALLPEELAHETQSKCIAVGCPKYVNSTTTPKVEFSNPGNYLIVIFENLHWERYSEEYRILFLQDLEKTARHFPDTTFLVKPHHAGVWLTDKYQGQLPQGNNIIIANPRNPQWEVFTAPALIAIADGAITTPSTVALDAAKYKCPVSVISYGLNLEKYEPLPLINELADWINFVETLQTTEGRLAIQQKADVYIKRNLIAGNAVTRILDLIANDIQKKNISNPIPKKCL